MNIEEKMKAIEEEINAIQESGEVADSNTWIQKFIVPKKNGKRYVYYRVVGLEGSKVKMVKYLGKKKKRAYQEYKKAVIRRNRIKQLQREYNKLAQMQKRKINKVKNSLYLQKFKLEQDGMLLNQLSPRFFPDQVQDMEFELKNLQTLIDKILTDLELGRKLIKIEKNSEEISQKIKIAELFGVI